MNVTLLAKVWVYLDFSSDRLIRHSSLCIVRFEMEFYFISDLNKMFSDYAVKHGARKPDETASSEFSGTNDSLPSRNRENSQFIIQDCPIVESSQKVSKAGFSLVHLSYSPSFC